MTQTHVFWFRRDLRWVDNRGLARAQARAREDGAKLLPIFIFDADILGELPDKNDARVSFIHDRVREMKDEARAARADHWAFHGDVLQVLKAVFENHQVAALTFNHDYEAMPIARDAAARKLAGRMKIETTSFKDQVIFEKSDIMTDAGTPYTVFTPYKRKWLKTLRDADLRAEANADFKLFVSGPAPMLPTLDQMGFKKNSDIAIPSVKLSDKTLLDYAQTRDLPALDSTSRLGLHLRFGTLSVRGLVKRARGKSDVWLSELIWREFFMQVLFHFPHAEKRSFRPDYDRIAWRKSPADFKTWREGRTGYPLVDAGMRELNATGFMHNRVRMVVASFLCKHLLLYWRQGERYFAEKLLDYELASNVGNWQWAAGSGCDAAPYFRVFNPEIQQKKFDPDFEYVRRWVPEFETPEYPKPMIPHAEGRDRALRAYHRELKGKKGKTK